MLGKQTQSCLLAKRSLSTRFALIGGRSRGAVRISVQAMAEMDMAPAANPPPFKMEVLEEGNVKPFARPLPLEPMQQTLSNIPLMVFYPALLAAVGVFGFTGLMAGKSMPVDTDTKDIAAYGTAALLAAGAAAVAVQAKKIRDSATIVDLYNQIVDLGDPTTLTSDIVAGVGSKYGINLQKEELDGLQRVYGEYLSCVIPKGDTQLMGDEPEKLIAFMTALGLTDEQAAPMHLEIGAKFYRDGFESKSRTLQNLNRRAFQRLVYVSSIMFGDQRASVLTPWGQNFKLTDAQLFVARRDNAKAIFKSQLEARGLGFPADRAFLQELREKQTQLKLMDESAEEVAKECSMAHVEVMLRRAMDCIKGTGKSRDAAGACAVLKEVLNYSRQLSALAGDESLIPGLGPVNIHGSVLLDPAHSKARELRELFKTFLDYYLTAAGEFTEELVADTKDMQPCTMTIVMGRPVFTEALVVDTKDMQCMTIAISRPVFTEELVADTKDMQCMTIAISRPVFTEELVADTKDMQAIMCIPARDASYLQDEVSAGLYKELLRAEVLSKRIDEAPATVLQALCQKVRFSPEAAMELHKELYKNKLKNVLEAKQVLSDADEADLARVRRILCLTNEVAQKGQLDVAGKNLGAVIIAMYDLGIKAGQLDVAGKKLAAVISAIYNLGITAGQLDVAGKKLGAVISAIYNLGITAGQLDVAWKKLGAVISAIYNLGITAGQLDVAGKKLGAVISAIYDLGINVVPEGELVRLDKTMKDLRLDKDVAVMVVKKVTIEKFRSYIKEVQKAAEAQDQNQCAQVMKNLVQFNALEVQKAAEAQDQNQCAQVMKNLVQFNALVVTPVLDKVKGTDAAKKELMVILMQAHPTPTPRPDTRSPSSSGGDPSAGQGLTPAPPPPQVVTPVLDKVKGTDAAKKELAEILMQAQQEAAKEDAAKAAKKEAENLQKVAESTKSCDDKTAEAGGEAVPGASRGEYTEEEKKAQKEISLKDAMEPDMKDKLYKQFLMITMQGGETKDLPLGGMETAKKKKKEETSKEGQMMEVASAHSTLAEDAYKQQAKEVMSSGPLNEEKNKYLESMQAQMGLTKETSEKEKPKKKKYLESMQAQMGLTKETSEKVLKEVRIEVYGTSSPVMEDGSSWNLARIMQHRAEGKTLEGVVEEVTRRNLYRRELGQQVTDVYQNMYRRELGQQVTDVYQNLYRRELGQQVSDGTGEADSEFLLTKLPEALELDKKKIERVIKEMVGSRRRTLLVQAVSQVRQKRPVDAMVSLNNLISCNKVMPENGPMPWNEQQEINDVFQAYCGKGISTYCGMYFKDHAQQFLDLDASTAAE
eukprot:gene30469-35480_t